MHTLGTYGRIHTKYKVSMFNPVAKGVCTDDANDDNNNKT